MTVALYFHTYAIDGRATLFGKIFLHRDGSSEREPVEWVARVDGRYVRCSSVRDGVTRLHGADRIRSHAGDAYAAPVWEAERTLAGTSGQARRHGGQVAFVPKTLRREYRRAFLASMTLL